MRRDSPSPPQSRGREDQSPEIEILHIPLNIPKNLSPPPPPNIGNDIQPRNKRDHNRKINGRTENSIEVIDVEDESRRTERNCTNVRGQYKAQKQSSSIKPKATIDYHHLKDPESSSDPLP